MLLLLRRLVKKKIRFYYQLFPRVFLTSKLILKHFQASFFSGAPWGRKFGNLSIREILVLTSAYANPPVHPYVQTLREREGSPKATRRGEENAIFSLAGNRAVLLGNQRFLAGNRMTIVATEKEVSLKA